ncbi:MAG TPA: phosphatidylserine decarboxylase family protein [Gemmatimonadaceae bacterium]|nr:phosphatidylserine decarboxylase family protein [Gemmatimonadaceae bacterium]
MSFAREGMVFIVAGAAAVVVVFALALAFRSWPLWLAGVAVLIVAIWIAYFFRDPERTGPRGDRLVIAPADGRVVMISPVEEPDFVQGRAIRISIFMNIFNVHVNRYPVNGTVAYEHYNPGKFLNAAAEKASLENEQMSVGIAGSSQKVLVRQIAGLVARRIVTYAKAGAAAVQGERMGIIRFGSRVDVFVPPDATIRTRVGERPVAGVTVLAELAS